MIANSCHEEFERLVWGNGASMCKLHTAPIVLKRVLKVHTYTTSCL